jgi:hypothetical protein
MDLIEFSLFDLFAGILTCQFGGLAAPPYLGWGGSTVKQGKNTPFRGRIFRPGTSGDLHSAELTSPTVTLFLGELTFSVWSQKTLDSGTRFLTGFNPPFPSQNSHFIGRKMYVNGRLWMAKLKGAGGVARSRRKEHLF